MTFSDSINSDMALKFKNLSKTVKERQEQQPFHHPPHCYLPASCRDQAPTPLSLPSSNEGGDGSGQLSQDQFSGPETETPFREGISRHCIRRVHGSFLEALEELVSDWKGA